MWSMVKAEPDESRVWTSTTVYNYEAPLALFFCFFLVLLSFCPFVLFPLDLLICLFVSPIRKERAVIDPDIKHDTKGN